ncbi:uncharacterized protein LY79DRAFT_530661 [Colletotrichum navitas]|uniref:N-acetylglucosamine-induced protein 1 n=1 Tax=Colletotrichum navitas TaxID=681940 RepID=A0AAD8PIU9_9PEZI|nr:uncharacterized protein LY79DRAFT_530661 [Colletotrichum navitas]KAK1564044.1 hypothetical protein LY79DRAFT_530661 [Colletotrichum navitas]
MDVETLIKNAPVKLSDKDIKALRDGSEESEPQSWEEVKGAIAAGETGRLRRSPRDLRNYMLWHAEVSKTYGSVVQYVRRERLHWPEPIVARNAEPFAHADDWTVIWNDWPYHLAHGMMHLVVWSKSGITVDPETGLPTEHSTRLVESFLDRVFGQTLGCRRGEDLLWFKQKTESQSVKALEHIHVVLRNVPEERVEKLLGRQRSQTLQVLVGNSTTSTKA